jgi:hypothetical protein
MRTLLLTCFNTLLFCAIPFSAHAFQPTSDTYKCIYEGKTTFSQTPCIQGKSELIDIKTTPVSKEDYQKSVKQAAKDKKELAKIIKEKDKENTQYRKNASAAYKKDIKAKEKCEDYKMKAKWAKEDLKNTQPKSEIKAQIKLKRAKEKMEQACKV